MDERGEESLQDLLKRRDSEKSKATRHLGNLEKVKADLNQILSKLNGTRKRSLSVDSATKAMDLHFAIKQASENGKIEQQVIEYINKKVDTRKYNIITTFNWKERHEKMPLVVFCNYSSRIGVDIEYSLRGVNDPEVILIVMHLCRKALIRGDLSDTDYLLSNDLKQRVAYIGHFAFDDNVYDCEQNRQQRDRLCDELQRVLKSRQ